jgi:fructokinase
VCWTLEAHYIAQVIHNLIMAVAPDAVVLGGGVLDTRGLRDQVREQLVLLNGDYLDLDIDRLTLTPAFGHRSGLVGAAIMAGLAV